MNWINYSSLSLELQKCISNMLYSNYNLAFFLLLFENYLTIHSLDCRIDFSFSTLKYRREKMASHLDRKIYCTKHFRISTYSNIHIKGTKFDLRQFWILQKTNLMAYELNYLKSILIEKCIQQNTSQYSNIHIWMLTHSYFNTISVLNSKFNHFHTQIQVET